MNSGWNFFFSLLLADLVGGASALLGLKGWTPWIVGAIVFVVFVILFSVNSMIRKRRKASEKAAADKIAECQEQMTTPEV